MAAAKSNSLRRRRGYPRASNRRPIRLCKHNANQANVPFDKDIIKSICKTIQYTFTKCIQVNSNINRFDRNEKFSISLQSYLPIPYPQPAGTYICHQTHEQRPLTDSHHDISFFIRHTNHRI